MLQEFLQPVMVVYWAQSVMRLLVHQFYYNLWILVSVAPTVHEVNVNLLIPVSFGRGEELVIRDGSIRLICSLAPV